MAKAAVKKTTAKATKTTTKKAVKTVTKATAKKRTTTTKKKASEVIDVKKLSIIKHANHVTKPKTENKYECAKYVFYDGETLTATNMHMVVQVKTKLPNYEAGTYFDNKGNMIEPNALMKEFPFPIETLNRHFSNRNVEFASVTMKENSIEHLYKGCCEAFKAALDASFATIRQVYSPSELKKRPSIRLELESPLMKIEFSESAVSFEMQVYDPIAEKINHTKYHKARYDLPDLPEIKISLHDYLKKPEKYPQAFETFPLLNHPLLLNPLYFYWAVRILKEHGAKDMKLYRGSDCLILESSVGRALILMLRDPRFKN